MSFQKVVKQDSSLDEGVESFRTVSFQKVVKLDYVELKMKSSFRTVSFQKVVKQSCFLVCSYYPF